MDSVTSSVMKDLSTVSTVTGSKKQLTQDDFLKIMLKQLQQQDPSNPEDITNMTNQFAQFNMVNSLQGIQTTLNDINSNNKVSQTLQSIGLVGKTADVSSNEATLDISNGMKGTVKVKDPTNDITLNISDANGKLVKQVSLGNVATAGDTIDFNWDGKLADGSQAAPGIYQISAIGKVGNNSTALQTYGGIRINSVNVGENGAVNLTLANNKSVSLNDILKVF